MQHSENYEDVGIHPTDYADLFKKESPLDHFTDTPEALLSLVGELYDSDHLNKETVHRAIWWLCVNFGEGQSEKCMDHYEPNDLVIEHWRDKSILNNNP